MLSLCSAISWLPFELRHQYTTKPNSTQLTHFNRNILQPHPTRPKSWPNSWSCQDWLYWCTGRISSACHQLDPEKRSGFM